jgi:multicomponent Na+:H+ antiporter subunit G
MISLAIAVLILLGAAFVLVAAIGVARLPDVLCRMHAATKAGAFGTALLLGAAALHFRSSDVVLKAALGIVFFYLTAPIAGHLLGRAAWRRRDAGVALPVDEWKSRLEGGPRGGRSEG